MCYNRHTGGGSIDGGGMQIAWIFPIELPFFSQVVREARAILPQNGAASPPGLAA